MVEINNLSFVYPKTGFAFYKTGKEIFHDLSFSLEKGRVYGLLGKNGAGKSTLLHLISGLLTPKNGNILMNGTDVRRRLPLTLKDMFIVPEEFELPSISLINYIDINSAFYPKFNKDEMIKYLHFFELDLDMNLGALSMGQKKKVFMSFALATNVSVLIMDEPTNGLDIPGKSQFRKFISSGMNDEKIILISTHQVKDVDKLIDHVIILEDSKILLDESMEEITRKYLFLETDNKDIINNALYSIPSLQGDYVILPNENGEESQINLELLFGAITSKYEKHND
ncbi:ABC transporter ATP-binding protein [Phocaeicola paurosaccharolyticus]|jgi:ABC-2 type transport system ATP-binding protein|uniref:ABC transporter ATP-binding protein n=1 Tax=Phocaeicola paurosaccharolyticus TaxID=732242 RepID=UPI0004683BA2|nr:ABC transporter ATP-binding protein [Phocaeicola paurosaccharolyticus]